MAAAAALIRCCPRLNCLLSTPMFATRLHWNFLLCLAATLCLEAALCEPVQAQTPAHPYPQHIVYAPGTIYPTNYTQAQIDADVATFYDYWKQTYVKAAGVDTGGHQLYRIAFGKTTPDSAATVSEGQGYGMVILPLMAGHDPDAHAVFDGLAAFAAAYPSVNDSRLMQWKVPVDPGDTGDSAFDGDADIAYGLMLADAQWGSAGSVNYLQSATNHLAGILASTIGPQSRLPMLGDWVSPNAKDYNQYQPRTSDIMPSHFRAWARLTGNTVWNDVATNCAVVVDSLQANYSPATGLLPDFSIGANPLTSVHPAAANFLEGADDGHYSYNAGRDPWRLALDALLNGNAKSGTQAKSISTWLKTKVSGNPLNIRAGYLLNGSNITGNNYFTSFFVAPVGVASMLDVNNQAWLNAIYASVRTDHEDYYEDSVTLLSLLAMSGNYWDPTTIANQPQAVRLYALPPDGTMHLSAATGTPALNFNVSAQAGTFAFTVERTTDLRTWTTVAQRASGAGSFQASVSGITIQETPQSQMTSVQISDALPWTGGERFYRLRVVR